MEEFYKQQTDVVIHEEAIEKYADRFINEHVAEFLESSSPLQFPLQFPSLQEEVNLVALKELLMVGGMFEHAAPSACQESLSEVVLFGLIGAFLTESTLNATFMRGLSASDVAQMFSLPTLEKTSLPQEQQDSGLASLMTMEKRGALADYAEMLASCAYHAGASLKDNEHPDLSSLLEKENLEDGDTSLETSSRNLTSVIQSLDDRHFVSVKRAGSEHMIELPFLKNARRMVSAVFLKRCEQLDDVVTDSARNSAKLNEMIAAPSVRTINSLLSLGVLTRCSVDEGAEENKLENIVETPDGNTGASSTIGKEVSMRCAAVVACWQLANAIQQRATSQHSELAEKATLVTPIQLSIFLDAMPKPGADDSDDSVNKQSFQPFVPHETGQKW